MKSRTYKFAHSPAKSARRVILAVATATLLAMAIVPVSVAQIASIPLGTPDGFGIVSRATADGKALHVTVGHSIFVKTNARLKRVVVADPAVLSSMTLTANEIVVTAMTPGVSSLTLLDETGQAESYVVSSDLDIEGLRTAMSQAMHGDAVKVDGSGGRVVLSGTVASDAIADSAMKLAGLYSKEVSNALTVQTAHPKQVRLQVRILEVDRSKMLQLGINLFNPGGNTSFLAGTTTAQFPSTMQFTASSGGGGNIGGGTLTTSNPLNFMFYSAKLNLGATIEDLQTKQVLQILAEPTITAVNGQKANFLSGGEFPFPIVQPGGGSSAPVVTIQFRPYGVKVEFTPTVNDDGTIRLHVAPEVSALDYSNAVTVGGFSVPALSTRKAETEVELKNNQSFAISGLLDQRTTDLMNKTPGASSLPIIGALFKSKNTNHSTSELVVLVTATIVDPLTDTAPPAVPTMPIPMMNPSDFDKSLGKDRGPQPAAPTLAPAGPPMGSEVPPASAAPAPASSPATGVTQGVAPAAALQTTPAAIPSSPENSQPSSPAKAVTGPQLPSSAPALAQGSFIAPAQTASVNDKPAGARGASGSMVEVVAFSQQTDADAMVAALNRRGYNVAVNRGASDLLLHLDVGPFASTSDAEQMRQRLLLDGYNATVK